MNVLKNFSLLALLILLLSSCGGDHLADPDSFPKTYATTADFLQKNSPQVQNVTFDASQGILFTTRAGSNYNFPPNIFVDGQGNAVTGNIDIEIVEVRKKSEMIYARTSTLTTKNELLESGGMFRVIAKQNGSELFLAPGQTYSVNFITDTLIGGMSVFSGDGEQFIQWTLDTTSNITADSTESIYELTSSKLNWVNIDKFVDGPFTTLTITPQSAEKVTDVKAFVIYKNLKVATHLPHNHTNNHFSLSAVPYNQPVTLVLVGLNAQKRIVASFFETQLGQDKNYELSLSEMTDEAFKSKVEQLDK